MSQTPTMSMLPADPLPRRRPSLQSFRIVWPLAALGLLLGFNAVFTAHFFDLGYQNGRLFGTPLDVLHFASPIVLLALGMTLVIATGGIDLSVGATMAITATVSTMWFRHAPDHSGTVVVGCLLGLVAALACGAWNGLLVAVFNIQPFVATLILMIAGRGVAELLSDQTITVPQFTLGWLHYLGTNDGFVHHLLYPLPLDLLWAAGAFVAVAVLTRWTALGLFLESVGNNAVASRYAGVNATGVKFAAYLVCGLTAGFAGLIDAGDLDASKIGLGTARELDAILAVSLGGTALAGGRFSLAGSVVGAVTIGTLNKTILQTHIRGHQIPNEWFMVAEAVVILIVCLLQSDRFRGLMLSVLPSRSRSH